MHGWISLPGSWQLALLVFAALSGWALGRVRGRGNGVLLWLGFSLVYAIFAVLVAYFYESREQHGAYNLAAWSMLVVPALVVALPAMGLPWALASAAGSGRALASPRAFGVVDREWILATFALIVGVAVLGVFSQNGRVRSLSSAHAPSSYVIKPIDPASAPADLSEITAGSQWSCVILREGEPSSNGVDYYFSPMDGGARWQSFSHQSDKRPFFDLAHATGLNEFFAGSYHVENGALRFTSDVAGRTLDYEHRGAMKIDPDALRARHDPRLRGEMLLNKNGWSGVFETISIRSLTPDAMSIVAEIYNDQTWRFEQTCQRVRDPAFQPITLLEPRAD